MKSVFFLLGRNIINGHPFSLSENKIDNQNICMYIKIKQGKKHEKEKKKIKIKKYQNATSILK